MNDRDKLAHAMYATFKEVTCNKKLSSDQYLWRLIADAVLNEINEEDSSSSSSSYEPCNYNQDCELPTGPDSRRLKIKINYETKEIVITH